MRHETWGTRTFHQKVVARYIDLVAHTDHHLTPRSRFAAEALVIFYIAAVAEIALRSHMPYLLFPELGALVYDILLRPWGKWASQPLRLILTPSITALLGTIVTRHLPFNGLTVALIVTISAAVVLALRSFIIPAMSAGLLPLVLELKSWGYPASIFVTLTALALISVAWRRYHRRHPAYGAAPDVEDILESTPRGGYWFVLLVVFCALMAEAARLTGLRFLIFPPLATMAFEMFGHPETCSWTKRPISFPIACFLVAVLSLLAFHIAGTGYALAVCAVVIGVVALRSFDLHMPPAMAIGLLLAAVPSPDLKYPLAILLSTSALTAISLLHQRLAYPTRREATQMGNKPEGPGERLQSQMRAEPEESDASAIR